MLGQKVFLMKYIILKQFYLVYFSRFKPNNREDANNKSAKTEQYYSVISQQKTTTLEVHNKSKTEKLLHATKT